MALAMANRARPRCPTCEKAMVPLYRRGRRGSAFVKVPDVFWCDEDASLARGRKKASFA